MHMQEFLQRDVVVNRTRTARGLTLFFHHTSSFAAHAPTMNNHIHRTQVHNSIRFMYVCELPQGRH